MEKSASVEKIRQRILTQANKQALDIQSNAEDNAYKIEENAKERANSLLKTELEKRQDQVQDQVRRELGQEKVEIHRHLLAYRSDQVDSLFAQVMEYLKEYTTKKTYKTTLKNLLIDSGTKMGSKIVHLRLNRVDSEWFTKETKSKIEKEIQKTTNQETEIILDEDPHSGIGGVIVSNDDKSATLDNTFEARVERTKDDIRSDVERLLFEIES